MTKTPETSGKKSAQQTHSPMNARVKVWMEVEGRYVFGHGLSEILKAVETAGSIKAAAGQLGKSYRHIWGRIKEAEEDLGQSLVEARVGGAGTARSSLTDLGRRLVCDYDALRSRLFAVAREEFATRFEGIRE